MTAKINTRQLRELHALLRDHGISGDKAVHDYIATALTERGMEPVESRKDLTQEAAAHLIADLSATEVIAATVAGSKDLKALRAPFPEEAIGKLPRSACKDCSDNKGTCTRHPNKSRCNVCGNYHSDSTIHLDFVGHADVTARLLEVDPLWTWRPFTGEELAAIPPNFRDGLWIMLTVLGVERPGFGDADGKRGGSAAKEAIGDALRNAAMRFGVALDLWAKGDREWAHTEKTGAEQEHPDAPPPRQEQPPAPYAGPSTEELLARIDADADRLGITYEAITEKMRKAIGAVTQNGPLTVTALDALDPWVVADWADSIHARADEVIATREATAAVEAAKTDAAKAQERPDVQKADDPWATPGPAASGEQPPE